MGTAFLGYVLPWGQISLWGATVITNLISAFPYVGPILVEWIWGSFRVGSPTLHRFYSLHFILPFLIMGGILLHLKTLHTNGSTNPLGDISKTSITIFVPYYSYKDLVGFIVILGSLFSVAYYYPYNLGDPENFNPANRIVTPIHIIPEWYFLFAYAVLRIVPRKLGGVIALGVSICSLLLFPLSRGISRSTFSSPSYQITFWLFAVRFTILTWLGGKPIEQPFVALSILFSVLYFLTLIILFLSKASFYPTKKIKKV